MPGYASHLLANRCDTLEPCEIRIMPTVLTPVPDDLAKQYLAPLSVYPFPSEMLYSHSKGETCYRPLWQSLSRQIHAQQVFGPHIRI